MAITWKILDINEGWEGGVGPCPGRAGGGVNLTYIQVAMKTTKVPGKTKKPKSVLNSNGAMYKRMPVAMEVAKHLMTASESIGVVSI